MNSLDNVVLGGGYLNMPTFIGNYLLDLVSLFFPFFLLIIVFVTGLKYFKNVSAKSGDWKSGIGDTLPSVFSIFVVLGILSLKEPIQTNNEFFKDTNNYAIVNLITTSIGMGSVLADALTHKMIYGNINVSKDSANNFNGFFPNALEESLKKEEETKTIEKTLVEIAKKEELIGEIEENNEVIANMLHKEVLIPLYNTGMIRNHFGNFQSVNDRDKTNSFTLSCNGGNCNILQKINEASGLNSFSNVKLDDIKTKDIEAFKIEGTYNVMAKDSYDKVLKINFSEIIQSENKDFVDDGEDYEFRLNLNNIFDSYYGNDYSNANIKTNLGLLSKNNFDLEFKMINTTRALLNNYIKVYEEYKIILEELEDQKARVSKDSKMNEKEKKAMISFINDEIKKYSNQLEGVFIQQIKEVSLFYRDALKIFETFGKNLFFNEDIINKIKDPNLINKLNAIMKDDNFFNNLVKMKNFNDEEFKELNDNYDLLSQDSIVFKYSYYSSERSRKSGENLAQILNAKYNAKKRNILILYTKMKRVFETDTLFQKALGLTINTPYAKAFLSANSFKLLEAITKEKESIRRSYLDSTGKLNVTSILNKKIEEINPNMSAEVINWQDLGKNWATFKNAYSPIFNEMQTIDKMKNLNDLENIEMLKAMQEAEPSGVANNVLNGLGGYATYKGASIVKDIVVNKFKKQENKFEWFGLGKVLDIFKAFGVVYGLMFLTSIIIPSVLWLLVNLSYYVEVAIYVAILPIGFIFMLFQSYNQGYAKYFYMLLGFILLPVILTSIFFITLYIDMLVPMFLKEFLPFASSTQSLTTSINIAMGGNDGIINSGVIGTIEGINKVATTLGSDDIMSYVGYFIYTILGILLSIYLMFNWFRANEYMTKILSIGIIGNEAYSNKDTLSRFSSFETYSSPTKLTKF